MDDKRVIEIVGKFLIRAQKIDGLSDGLVSRHRNSFALYQPPGRFVLVGQSLLSQHPVALGNSQQHPSLRCRIELAKDIDRVIGRHRGDGLCQNSVA
jgi:hypothetical protein